MKLSYHLLMFIAVLFFLTACKRENYAVYNKGNTPLVISASKNSFVLKEKEGLSDAVIYNWTSGSNQGTNAAILYTLQLAKQGTNFANPITEIIGKAIYTRKFSVQELNDSLLNHFNALPGQVFTLEARIIATTQDNGVASETSSAITISVTPYKPVSATLYLLGDVAPDGWDNTKAIPLTAVPNSPGAFKWTGKLNAGNFKFITTLGQWLPSYNKGSDNSTMVLRTDAGQPDNQWQIATAGIYIVEVDIINLTISVLQSSAPPYSRLWIVGSATPNGWNISSPNEMLVDSSNLFVFNYNEVLTAGEFKFPTATGNWSTDYYMPLVNYQALSSTDVQLVTGGSVDYKWQITDAGAYKIKLDLLNMKVYIKPFTPYTKLWMVGDATPVGWNIDNPAEMTVNPSDPYEFTWTGPLTAGEFKIPTAKGNWGCDYFMPLIDQQGINSHLAKFVTSGSPDHKWRITVAGNYSIIFNQLKETIDIIKL